MNKKELIRQLCLCIHIGDVVNVLAVLLEEENLGYLNGEWEDLTDLHTILEEKGWFNGENS